MSRGPGGRPAEESEGLQQGCRISVKKRGRIGSWRKGQEGEKFALCGAPRGKMGACLPLKKTGGRERQKSVREVEKMPEASGWGEPVKIGEARRPFTWPSGKR